MIYLGHNMIKTGQNRNQLYGDIKVHYYFYAKFNETLLETLQQNMYHKMIYQNTVQFRCDNL